MAIPKNSQLRKAVGSPLGGANRTRVVSCSECGVLVTSAKREKYVYVNTVKNLALFFDSSKCRRSYIDKHFRA